MSSIGVSYWNKGCWVTIRNRNDSHQCPTQHVWHLNKAGCLVHTAQSVSGSTGQIVPCRRLSCFDSLLCTRAGLFLLYSSVGLCLFLLPGFVWEYFMQTGLSEQFLLFIHCWEGRSLVNMLIFRDFLDLAWGAYILTSLPSLK